MARPMTDEQELLYSARDVEMLLKEKTEALRDNLEIFLYSFSYDGTPRAFRWLNGKVQVAELPELELVWYDLS